MAVLLVAVLISANKAVVSCGWGWWSSLVGHAPKVLPVSSTAVLVPVLVVIGACCVVSLGHVMCEIGVTSNYRVFRNLKHRIFLRPDFQKT